MSDYPSDPPPIEPKPLQPKPLVVRTAVRHLTCGLVSQLEEALAPSVARHPHRYARLWCDGCAAWCPREEFRWRDGEPIAWGDGMV